VASGTTTIYATINVPKFRMATSELKTCDAESNEIEEKGSVVKIMFDSEKIDIETIFNDLKGSGLNQRQKKYIGLLETKIQEFTTQAELRKSDHYYKLTPTEIKISGLIRIGKTSKEIATLLDLSTRTVEVHRNNIRNKLGIRNKKLNLRNFLMTL
jgi:DNA-binding CsgD family transcriptional regulator